MKAKKSWAEKLADSKGLPKVGPVDGKSKRFGSGIMVIPAPVDVDALMRRVPKGRLVTINELREALATRYAADFACPMTTGIFAWIAAHAAAEARSEGKRRVTPFWRTLKRGGELNAKYPGGVAEVRRLLREEGHVVVKRGQRYFVKDHEQSLYRFSGRDLASAGR